MSPQGDPELAPPPHAGPFPVAARGSGAETGRRVILSLAVAAMGLVDLASALLSHPPERLTALRRLIPTEVLDTSRTFTLLAGALLLVTAWGLRRGKRRAYVVALLLCAVSVPVNLLKALDIEEAVVAAGLMFLLGISAEAFRVRSRAFTRASLKSGALWFALALLGYIIAGELALKWNYGVGTSVRLAFRDAGYYLLGLGHPVSIVTWPMPASAARIVTWYHRSLPLLGLSFVLFVTIGSLRPATHRRRHRAEAETVAQLLRAHGESTVSAFALADDADYFFSPNRRAVIAYRFEADTLLAIGDPIGPPEELRPLLEAFVRFCRDSDWQFAFFQARPEHLDLYRSVGLGWLHIGEDPVLRPDQFSLEGSAMGDVRRAVRKCEEAGVTIHHFIPGTRPFGPGHGGEWLEQLRAISNQWLHAHAGAEKTFCMGRFDEHRLGEVWVAVAWHEARSRVEGFVTWVPVWGRKGWALDLMRRRDEALPGTMEMLVVRSVEAARARGDAMMSLSLSALASVEPGRAPRAARATATRPPQADSDRAREFLAQHLARFYDFKGLFRWKKKFDPEFEDRYLVYPGPLSLPRVALALVRAQSPGGLSSYVRSLFPPRAQPPAAAASGERPAESVAPS